MHPSTIRADRLASLVLVLALWHRAGAETAPRPASIGDERLQVAIEAGQDVLTESGFRAGKQPLPGLRSAAWMVRIDGRDYLPARASVTGVQPLRFAGETPLFDWTLEYRVTGPGRITKTLRLTARRDLKLETVTLWQAREQAAPQIARTSLQDICAFYRQASDGLFVSLDFPWSRIGSADGKTSVSYPPARVLRAGEPYTAHSLTIGAVRWTQRLRGGMDEGQIDAMDAYVQERFAPRFERPMILSCSINNRYTQPRGEVIFYTMKDHPTLCENTGLLERELALMPALGVEYYQVFPGVFDWAPGAPRPEEVDRLMGVARGHGLRMGDYSGANSLFCPHYNAHRNHLDRPEWRMRAAGGQAGGFCFGHPAFVDHYIQTVVPTCRRHGFELHCLDFLNIAPCWATDHGHPAGPDGVYHQVAGLVRLLEAINAVSPRMMTWSNSGNWAELLPKIAWSNPNLYLTDPFIATPWPGLNMTRLLDDARREQMVTLHDTRFIPYRFLTNCQYFFSQNSIVPDIRHYQYGVLSTLAVTPNLCLGEIRPWLDRLSEADRREAIGFYRHWTSFVREHFALWKHTYEAGETPGIGSVELYGHSDGNRGFVFLVNPQYWDRTVDVPLDERLGFIAGRACEIAELHPVPRLRLAGERPTATTGSSIRVEVPAQQVIVLEVRPAPAELDLPRLYGLPGTIESRSGGYLLKTSGMQGSIGRAAIVLPRSGEGIAAVRVREDVPQLDPRLRTPTRASMQALPDRTVRVDLAFRGTPVPAALSDWQVRPGGLEEGVKAGWSAGFEGTPARFPLFASSGDRPAYPVTAAGLAGSGFGPLADFLGAYIENAFGESQETWVELARGDVAAPQTAPAPADRPAPARETPAARDARAEWWLQARFRLPFMYTIGAEPAFDEHTILVLPMIHRPPGRQIRAWINRVPLEVRLYRYPRNRHLGCHYADLVGSGAVGGDNLLVLQLGS